MRSRAGFTLIELLIVTILLVVTVSALFGTLGVQQRSSQEQSAVISAQQTTRTALAVLASELREISAADGDLIATTATSLTFRALGAVAFVCEEDQANAWAEIWIMGDTLSKDDAALVFVDGDAAKSTDDSWRLTTVANIGSPQSCPGWTAKRRQRLILTSAALAGVEPGAPVRAYRSVSYGLVDMGGKWVLARQRGAEAAVELVGPLASDGLSFRYYRADGTEISPAPSTAADRENVAMIEILVRASHRGSAGQTFGDSLVSRVALRGNPRQ